MLARLNRELAADFDLGTFSHAAVYDARHGRIEMRLVSNRSQVVTLAGVPISFRAGEHIVSEHSHKYTVEEIDVTAQAAGWRLERSWTDDAARFSVNFLRAR